MDEKLKMKKKKIPPIKQDSSVKILKWIILFFTLPLVIAGILSIQFGNRQVRISQACLSWPGTQGIIKESYVKRCWSNESCYEPEIKYSYTVNGKTYTNNTITFDDGFVVTLKTWSETFIQDYPKDNTVMVYYNPENPENSLLERRELTYIPIWIHTGYFLIISGIIFLIGTCIGFIYIKVKDSTV